jgi:hypothetical protein
MDKKTIIKIGDVKYDEHGKMTVMAVANGYIMARRPRCMPFVALEKIWNELSDFKHDHHAPL